MAKTYTNTVVTASNNLIKEDVADKLFNVEPDQTPICSLIGYKDAKSRTPNWFNDNYRAPDATNAKEPGFKAEPTADTAPTEAGNYAQIFSDTISVDDAMAKSDIYGNYGTVAHRLVKVGVELRRDLESAVVGSTASVKPVAGTAGKLAGFGAITKTNVNLETGGSAGGFQSNGTVSARTKANGNTRVLTEAMFKDALAKRFTATGETMTTLHAFCSIGNKQKFSGFSGRSIDRTDGEGNVVSGSVDVYVSDAGKVLVHAHPYIDDEAVHIIDPKSASIGVFRKYQTKDLGKSGDSTEKMALMEATLVVESEEANALVGGLKLS